MFHLRHCELTEGGGSRLPPTSPTPTYAHLPFIVFTALSSSSVFEFCFYGLRIHQHTSYGDMCTIIEQKVFLSALKVVKIFVQTAFSTDLHQQLPLVPSSLLGTSLFLSCSLSLHSVALQQMNTTLICTINFLRSLKSLVVSLLIA